MNYSLIVGTAFKKYKKPAEITISVNDRFLDSFTLHKDYDLIEDTFSMIDTEIYSRFQQEHMIKTDRWKDKWSGYPLPKLIKIYEIPEEHLGGILQINVANSSSDFTNGFMKNSSLIRFPILGLVPSNLLSNKTEKLMKKLLQIQDLLRKHESLKNPNKIEYNHRFPWPCIQNFYVRRPNEIYEKSGETDVQHWIGGDFTIEIPINKKHKIYQIGNTKDSIGFYEADPRSLAICSFKPLINILSEDQ